MSRNLQPLGWTLLLLLGFLAFPGSAVGEEEKPEKPKKEEKASEAEPESAKKAETDKPRVITNEDLEKYGKSGSKGRAPVQAGAVVPVGPGEPVPGAPGELPPLEDRLDGSVTRQALQVREGELVGLLAYLEGKERWLRNPLGRPPEPPPGEPFLDPAKSGSLQLAETRERIDDTRLRLDTIRGLLLASEPRP